MTKRTPALTVIAMALSASPSFATGEISCGDGKGAGLDLLVGHVDFLSVSRAVVTVGDKVWSSTPESWPGTPIAIGQGFEDAQHLSLDLMDEGMSETVARLRLVKLVEGDRSAFAGVLSVKGEGVWAVDCTDPE